MAPAALLTIVVLALVVTALAAAAFVLVRNRRERDLKPSTYSVRGYAALLEMASASSRVS
jgi:hypothetical protein